MNNPNTPAPWEFEFETLMKRLLDVKLDGAEQTRLNALLAENPAAMDAYVQLMRLDTLLRYRNSPPGVAAPSTPVGEGSAVSPSPLMGEGSSSAVAGLPTVPPSKSPVLGFLGGVVDYVSHSRTLMFWLIGGSLGLYFAVQLGSLMVSRFWAQNATQLADDRGAGTDKRGQIGGQPGVGAANGAKIVATLTNSVDCQWKFSRSGGTVRIDQPESVALEIGTEFRAGQKLNLTAGLAELTFDSGAKVILTAPARFDVTDSLGGDLERGKLTAKVPHTASGFTVATPGGKVVDLGTEFGVKVNDDGMMNVIVYVGDVKVESGAGGGTGSGGADQPKAIHVHAGQAFTIGPDHIAKPIPPENERFVREIGPLGDKTKAEAAYIEFMKSLKPVFWFRMEGQDADRVLHDEMGGPDAKLAWDGPGNPFVKGQIGKGLWLRGPKLNDGAVVADYPKSNNGKISFVAWAYAESRPPYATIAMNWGANNRGQFGFHLSTDPGKPDGDLGISFGLGRRGAVREGADHPFPLYEWQHVAFTCDGQTLRMYRQGREVAAGDTNGVGGPGSVPALGVGIKVADDGHSVHYPWDGKLDEVALFNDALTAEQIRKLANFVPR